MLISVVVTTYNHPEWLEKVLHGFAVQTDRDFELVVADDGSGPETRALLDRLRPALGLPISHVWHEDRGFRKCEILNEAILAARGEYLVFTDGDCIPRRDFLAVHRRLATPGRFLSGGYLKLPMALSRRITVEDVVAGRATDYRWLRAHGLPRSRRALRLAFGPALARLMDAATPTRPSWNGHNASAWRRDLLAVNGFEERMGYGGLDRELGERLENAGIRGRQIRHRAIVVHLDHGRGYRDEAVLRRNREIRREVAATGRTRSVVGLDRHRSAGGDGSDAPPPPRIAIVNAVALNGGDAAILAGAVRSLREAYGGRDSISVSDDDPRPAARLYPELDFVPALHAWRMERGPARLRGLARSIRRRRVAIGVRLLRFPRLALRVLDGQARSHLAWLRAADVVVSTGGTYLVEHYPVARRLHELMAARALGRPTYFYTQSLGPFLRRGNRRLAGRELRAARAVFVRDERSRANVLVLGVRPERVILCPDAAFALAETASPAAGAGEREGGAGPASARRDGPLRVAVSVREWQHFRQRPRAEGLEAYRRAVADAVRRLAAAGARVTFLSTCQGVPEYWTDDAGFARALVEELLPGVPGVEVESAHRAPGALITRLRDFDLAIATRMHFGILALAAGVPVVPIAYEFKTAELFAGLGMGEFVEDIETITPEGLWGRVDACLRRWDEVRERIAHVLPELRRDAATPARVIRRNHPPTAAPPEARRPDAPAAVAELARSGAS